MVLKSAKHLPALKSYVTKRATPGEKVLGKLFPNRGAGFPGGWDSDHIKQVNHMVDWVYVAVHTICMKVASITPNMAWVTDANRPSPKTKRADQRGLLNASGQGFGGSSHIDSQIIKGTAGKWGQGVGTPTSGSWHDYSVKVPMDSMIGAGSSSAFLTMGEYRSKALSVVKPHEELEPIETGHLLRRLVDSPNPTDTSFDFRYERTMFLLLCGASYEWVIPNAFGRPCERWVIPAHWVWPRTGGGQVVDADHPDADRLIQYYEVRPWGGMGSAGMLKLPPDQVIMHRFKSPVNKLLGYSKLWALSRWIDVEESISNSRFAQMSNQARPEFWVEMPASFNDPDDSMIARWEAKIAQKHQGEFNLHRPLFMPAGAKAQVLSFSPEEMAYFNCLDTETECLTSAGWKKYNELTKDTKIACYDPNTKTLVYDKPSAIHIKPYKGKMHKWSGQRIDAMMSPNHRCYVERPTSRVVGGEITTKLTPYKGTLRRSKVRVGGKVVNEKVWDVVKVDQLAPASTYSIIGAAPAACAEPRWIEVDSYGHARSRNKEQHGDMKEPKNWLRFLGYYLSEGCVSGGTVDVCQKKHVDQFREGVEAIEHWTEIITSNGVHHWKNYDRGLRKHLEEHCGTHSINKRIPDYVKDWPAEYLTILFDALMLGDGTRREFVREDDGQETWHGQYPTVSKQLADDVMELAIKCGYTANIGTKEPGELGNHLCYIVNVSPKVKLNVTAEMRTQVDYDGDIWCVTVPTGLFVVRRNGKAHVTGNSEEQITNFILAGFGLSRSSVGLVTDMTFGSVLASLMGDCERCYNTLLTMEGQTETKHLASRFDEEVPAWSQGAGGAHGGSGGWRRCRLWYDNCTPADPAQVNSDIQVDIQGHAMTPNMLLALRGRPPYKLGGDNPLVQGPGGLMPLPINVEEKGDDITDLVRRYSESMAADKDVTKLGSAQSAEDVPINERTGEPKDGQGPSGGGSDVRGGGDPGVAGDTLAEVADGPKVEKPNGKPSKSLRAWSKRWRAKQHEGRSYSTTQFNLAAGYSRSEGPVVEATQRLIAEIDDADLAPEGKETIPHVTIRYGLETSDAGEVRQLVETFGPVRLRLGYIDCFEGEEHDVVIVRVESEDLERLHELLGQLPNVQTHPTYQPHVTLAHVRPGLGQEWVEELTRQSEDEQGIPFDQELSFTELVFSPKEGTPTMVELASFKWQEATGASSQKSKRLTKRSMRSDAIAPTFYDECKDLARQVLKDFEEATP